MTLCITCVLTTQVIQCEEVLVKGQGNAVFLTNLKKKKKNQSIFSQVFLKEIQKSLLFGSCKQFAFKPSETNTCQIRSIYELTSASAKEHTHANL